MASYHIDFDTMAGADKFGNIYFVRLSQDVSDEIEEDPTGGRIKWEQGKLIGAPNKVEEIVQFHVNDVISCLQKASLIPGGGECILYGTVMGSIGALHAFTSRDDVDFFSHLEIHMRQDNPPLCGRDHMAYRSAYFPVNDVIDRDLFEKACSGVVHCQLLDATRPGIVLMHKVNFDAKSGYEMIQSLLSVTNISSFLAGVLAWKDPHILVHASQIVEILMEKLPNKFSKMLVSITTTQASSREKDNDSISGASFHRKHYHLRSGNLNPDESLLDDLKIPVPVNVSGPPCFVETPTVN
ncbi:hypothetical protein KIW84_075161 [Lathyrus oleraceus]|uniref:RSE1/DDB1/CPSF1 C-terminal domain-containing protein n=1 Tax=Pisum sativum TaxID=3888 RepID=A0A9D4VU83_PEA|nr:hypothetical protein KIW84_075161 [Pisum sativum]